MRDLANKLWSFRPWRTCRPSIAARERIQHAIHDDFAIIAVGHHHGALPSERTGDEAAAEAGIVAALHGDAIAPRTGQHHAEAIAETVDIGQHLVETARGKG